MAGIAPDQNWVNTNECCSATMSSDESGAMDE